MCILDLSKLHMYNFHYNVIKSKYGSNAKLLFTDTDSLCYNIQTDDIYEDFEQMRDLFDNSCYPKDSKYFNSSYTKAIGKIKDECAFDHITLYVD